MKKLLILLLLISISYRAQDCKIISKEPLILSEGADHGISEFRNDMFYEMRRHFDLYVRIEHSLPNMEPHGK